MTWLIGCQLAAGILNVVLLAPVWLQLAHLLLADAVWIAYVFLGADTLASPGKLEISDLRLKISDLRPEI